MQKDPKMMAKRLRVALAAQNVSLSHSECLELVARQLGLTDWNTLAAKQFREEGTSVVPAPVPCSFCGKADVLALFEGGCSRPRSAPQNCVFICNECVGLCAEVSADILPR